MSTGISPKESVVILLHESKVDSTISKSQTKEVFVEECMTKAMLNKKKDLKIRMGKDFRGMLFPGKKFEEIPHSAEMLLVSLEDESLRDRVEKLGIRYVIVVNTDTSNTGKQTEFEFLTSTAPLGAWSYSRTRSRISSFSAVVIDVRKPAESGRIWSTSHGTVGYVVPFFLIVPLPPVPLFAGTESEACSALGDAVVGFLEGHNGS